MVAEISHYYPSTDDELAVQVSKAPKKAAKALGKKAASAQPAATPADDEGCDLEIIKEV